MLELHGVTGEDRRHYAVDRGQQRVVPRRDAKHHAHRHTLDPPREVGLGRQIFSAQGGGRERHHRLCALADAAYLAARRPDRLAHAPADLGRHTLPVGLQRVEEAAAQGHPLLQARLCRPRALDLPSAHHLAHHINGLEELDSCCLLARVRVVHADHVRQSAPAGSVWRWGGGGVDGRGGCRGRGGRRESGRHFLRRARPHSHGHSPPWGAWFVAGPARVDEVARLGWHYQVLQPVGELARAARGVEHVVPDAQLCL